MVVGGCAPSRRTLVMLRVFAVIAVVLASIGYLLPDAHPLKNLKIVPSLSRLCPMPSPSPNTPRPPVVNGLPTRRFRDNLRNDTYYITGWTSAGFTNAVMNFANMIYLGKLSDRVPIVPPFAPAAHISTRAGIIPFGDIFDLDILRTALNMDILDWRDVKDLPSRYSLDPYSTAEVEQLGCWTTTRENSYLVATSDNTVRHLGLDASYSKVPSFVRMPNEKPFLSFPQLAALVYPRNPLFDPTTATVFLASPEDHSLTPDAQLACFDSMYYTSSGVRPYEWERSWSPVWNTVGRNLHFTQTMQNLAHSYMMRAFGVNHIPLFIAIHIRHGDFHGQCEPHSHTEIQDGTDCFPPLSSYGHRVDEIKAELLEKRGLSVSSVIVMSDETSDAFWNSVKAQGWSFSNHTAEATQEKYGEWYAPILDTIIQSHAIGFVGTRGSTFSLIGERRVQDWHGGVYRDVSIRNGQ